MCIISKQEKMSLTHTASFLIPSEIAKKIKSGQELSDAANEVLGSESSNRDTIGILTDYPCGILHPSINSSSAAFH